MRCFVAVLSLAAALAVYRPGQSRAEPPLASLVGPPAGSLRGELIDVHDPWVSARLMTRFGENARAYEVLRRVSAGGVFDVRVERLETRLLVEMGLHERADSLLALRTHITDPREYYLHYLQRARLSALSGNYERVLDFTGRLDGFEDAVFEPYKDLLVVEALVRVQRPVEACQRGAERLAAGIPPALSPEFERRLLEAYLNSGQFAEALEFLQTLKARTSEGSLFAPVVAREVDVRFMLGDTLGAVRAAFDLATSSATPETADAVNGVASRVPVSKLSDEVLLEFTGVLLKRNRLDEAQRLMTVAQGRTIEGPGRERIRLLNSDLLYKERKYDAAQQEAERLFEDPSLERDAKLLRARIYRGMEQKIHSAESYEAFATAYPFDSKAPEALYVAGDLYREEGKHAKSTGLLTRIVETYPGHKYSRLATLRMALDHMARKEYTRGARMLEQTLERGGRDDAALLYYLAEMYGRMRKKEKQAKLIEEIVALNPVSFYLDPGVPASFVQPMTSNDGTAAADSQSVLEFLERVYEEREGACERIRDVLGAWENRSAPGEWGTYLIRGRAFLEMGFRDWAERELRILESKGPLPPRGYLELGALYDDFAMPWRSVRLFQRVYYSVEGEQRRKLDRDFELLMCPTPFPSLVFENCSRHGISPHLVYAMMRAESRFDEKAVSSAGAMGLMQIMPETGGQVAEELGFPAGARMDLLSPEINLAFGIKYASRLIERSNKDPLMMLAAYNAGFTNAKKWFGDASSKSSPAERVDGIDFGETREYIKRIVESARLYHAFYFSPEAVTGQPHPRPGTVPPSEGEQ